MALIKEVIHCIIKPFTYICNRSFLTGIFPDNMKIAEVLPVYKSGDKQTLTNDIPISLLPQFSKILQKLSISRLDSFLNKYDVLSEHQYGFRSNCSTSLAVMELVEHVAAAVDQKLNTVLICVKR